MNTESTSTTTDNVSRLRIDPARKNRGQRGPVALVILLLLLGTGFVFAFYVTRQQDNKPVASGARSAAATASVSPVVQTSPPKPGDVVLTVSGYVIPRERIEISPRFMGTVKAINVKKGDRVEKDTVIVQLDDAEFQARLKEAQGRLALANANFTNAEINLKRQQNLARQSVDSQRAVDDAQRTFDAAAAEVKVAGAAVALARIYVDWCTIRAPITGTILEKLVDPNELVVPQSFGGSRGPSTALVALADLEDLQVEIDVNETDLARVRMNQRCRISPEAYPDKVYGGFVAEIAPEANRTKGTLQIKVQVEKPDNFLTPELTAKVDFLAD